MTSPVAGAVRIMPAVGRGVPGTSTGVIETDSAIAPQHRYTAAQLASANDQNFGLNEKLLIKQKVEWNKIINNQLTTLR